ncbi:hypothetical protein GKC30_07095 [Pseudodesulfovibrio sp. F-1]|uniref:Uncharacterized protein n=1 Tax=Pseudodesulfovibrio alkaliphilus TaxID=2661613 RepID=A0A7K1KNC4_9BACT|nr:hypothetical protein [Pseudodesulfovibrio alkaliphilus]MUM77392.1 hypothetical protein [Pseudodesulfovibrio alkaliphilus]
MSSYENRDCWISEAEKILAEREDTSCEVEGVGTILFEKIGSKSATIRVNGRNIGSGGTGITLVNNLTEYLEKKFQVAKDESQLVAVWDAMNDLFEECAEEE